MVITFVSNCSIISVDDCCLICFFRVTVDIFNGYYKLCVYVLVMMIYG